jgi:hypothetical protein
MARIPYMRSDVREEFVEWAASIERRYEDDWEDGNFDIDLSEGRGLDRWFKYTRRDPEMLAFTIARDLWARARKNGRDTAETD